MQDKDFPTAIGTPPNTRVQSTRALMLVIEKLTSLSMLLSDSYHILDNHKSQLQGPEHPVPSGEAASPFHDPQDVGELAAMNNRLDVLMQQAGDLRNTSTEIAEM